MTLAGRASGSGNHLSLWLHTPLPPWKKRSAKNGAGHELIVYEQNPGTFLELIGILLEHFSHYLPLSSLAGTLSMHTVHKPKVYADCTKRSGSKYCRVAAPRPEGFVRTTTQWGGGAVCRTTPKTTPWGAS